MKLRNKVIASFLLCACSMVVVAYSGIRITDQLSGLISAINEGFGNSILSLQNLRSAVVELKSASSSINPISQSQLTQEKEAEIKELLMKTRTAHIGYLSQTASIERHPTSKIIAQRSEEVITSFEELQIQSSISRDTKELFNRYQELQLKIEKLIRTIDVTIKAELLYASELVESNRGAIDGLKHLHYFIVFLALLTSYLFAVALASHLSKPIGKILAGVRRIGSGDLSTRVAHSSSDELGELVVSINKMAVELEQTTVSRSHLDLLVKSIPDAIFVLDEMGKITAINKAATNILDYSEEQILNRSLSSFIASSKHAWIPSNSRSGQSGDFEMSELSLLNRQAEEIQVQMSSGVLLDEDSEIIGQVCVAKDIRVLRDLEAQRDQYRIELAQAERLASLGTVVAIIAHKINQPLTVIQLFIQQCLRENEENLHSELLEELLSECLTEVGTATSAVKEVLGVSRKSSPLEAKHQNIENIYTKVNAALRDQITNTSMKISKVGNWTGLGLIASPGELDSIFFFIIQNAIQAAKDIENPSLKVYCRAVEGSIEIEFVDTCGGIEEDDLDRVFETFFTTKSVGEGTGLGLPIVKQIVHRLQGQIKVKTTPGVGTTFFMTFPTEIDNTRKELNPKEAHVE